MSFDDGAVKRKISELLASDSEDELRSKYSLCTTDQWSYQRAKKELAAGTWKPNLFDYAHRPFSTMRSVFDRNVISILRTTVMKQLLSHNNIALVTSRVVNDADFAHIFVTDKPVDKIFLSSKTSTNAYVFPLYLYDSAEEQKSKRGGGTMQMALFEPSAGYATRRANLNPKFIQNVTQRLGLKWLPMDGGDFKKTIGPEDIFNYAYAVFHSPTYRERYVEFLRIDFPRLPLTSDLKLFRALVAKGAELVSLHLMKSPKLDEFMTEFPVKGDNEVEKVHYHVSDRHVWINAKQYFGGVPKVIWDFHVGGYQVCEKWLKNRKGHKLTYGDIQHYQKVIVSLSETIRLMREIDESIPNWPMQ